MFLCFFEEQKLLLTGLDVSLFSWNFRLNLQVEAGLIIFPLFDINRAVNLFGWFDEVNCKEICEMYNQKIA